MARAKSSKIGPKETDRTRVRESLAREAASFREKGLTPDDGTVLEALKHEIEQRAPKKYADQRRTFYRSLAKDASMEQQLSVYRMLFGALNIASQIRKTKESHDAKSRSASRTPGRPRKGTEAPPWQRMPRFAIFEPVGPGGSYKETSRQHRPRDAWQGVLISYLFADLEPVCGTQRKTLSLMADLFLWVFNIRHGDDWMKQAYKRVLRS